MTKRHYQQTIILSAFDYNLSLEENMKRTRTLKRCIESLELPYNTARGAYKGWSEASFVVLPNNSVEIEALTGLAFNQFGQESILYQDATGHCFLEYSQGNREYIGRFKEVEENQALQLGNYTFLNGRFYTVC